MTIPELIEHLLSLGLRPENVLVNIYSVKADCNYCNFLEGDSVSRSCVFSDIPKFCSYTFTVSSIPVLELNQELREKGCDIIDGTYRFVNKEAAQQKHDELMYLHYCALKFYRDLDISGQKITKEEAAKAINAVRKKLSDK